MLLAAAGALRAQEKAGLRDYLDGLDALETGSAAGAQQAMGRAVAADAEEASYYAGRGLAALLAGDARQAEADLQRALRLRPGDETAKLWLANVVVVTGDFFRSWEIYPAATHDLEVTMAREACTAYGNYRFRIQGGESEAALRAEMEQAWAGVVKAIAWYARRAKAAPELAPLVAARARERAASGDASGALSDLEKALSASPEDPELLRLHAEALLALGDAAGARQELTLALTLRSDFGPAYLAHARAASRLGDARRARADLEVGKRLLPLEEKQLRPLVEKELAASPDPAQVAALHQALLDAARGGATDQQLADRALAVRRAVNGRRLRHDEWYQERLRTLEDALREKPSDAGRLAALAAFLHEQASVRRERVEPRGASRLYRYQTGEMQEQELRRALELCDQALAQAPSHVRALGTKAALLMACGRYGDAETLIRQALKTAPRDPQVLDLFAQVLEVAAGQKTAQAANLRTPKYLGSHSETVGDWLYTYTWWHYPSAGEMAQAAQFDRTAESLRALALEQIDKAAAAQAGQAQGHYYLGLGRWMRGDLEGAAQAYGEALRLDPGQPRWHFTLAAIHAALGRTAEALEARLAGVNLVETSAAPLLELSWEHVAHTRWKSAREVLERAAALDPADARAHAYRGVIEAADGRPGEALVWLRAGLALEEARLRLAGDSAYAKQGRLAYPEMGLNLELRRQIGRLEQAAGKPEQALAVLEPALACETRLEPAAYAAEVVAAMLPDPHLDASVVPEAENALALSAYCRVDAGAALLALGRAADAARLLEPVEGYELLYVNGYGAGRVQRPRILARLLLCRAWISLGDLEKAWQYAQLLPAKRSGFGPSPGAYADLEDEAEALRQEVGRLRQEDLARGNENRDEWRPPDEQRVAALLRELGPAIGHPELGDGSRRYSGDGREAQLCAAVENAVRMIATPKSTRWRSEVVMGVQMVQMQVPEQEQQLAQLRELAQRSRGQQRGRRDPAAEAQQLEELLARTKVAVEKLKELAVQEGYPKDALEADLAAGAFQRPR